ncbi:MAG: hypothetical protein B6U87_02650 [Candidatus Aenigmarchaeota archaeon ex4484_52]|nr:MAG: hypothetical protein B6U87_02650 [Candidatus Aenigmarchaeota archaeon ex4484_52]
MYLQKRIAKLKNILKIKKIDAMFFYFDEQNNSTQANLFYFTGLWFCEPAVLIIWNSSYECKKIKKDTLYCCFPIDSKIPFNLERLTKNTFDEIFENKNKKMSIGIDNGFSYSAYAKINAKHKNINFINIADDIYKLRSIKTKNEIKKIKNACKIQRNIFGDLNKNKNLFCLTENKIANKIDISILESGCTNAFDTLISSYKNTSFIHYLPSSNLAQNYIMADFGIRYNFYNSDMTRMIFDKNAVCDTKEVKKAYSELDDLQNELDDFIKTGMNFGQINEFAKQYLDRNYKKTNFSNFHSLGHGIGIEVHEAPFFKNKEIIKENMVFTLEPGIYLKNKYGVRLEDVVVMRKNKIKRL